MYCDFLIQLRRWSGDWIFKLLLRHQQTTYVSYIYEQRTIDKGIGNERRRDSKCHPDLVVGCIVVVSMNWIMAHMFQNPLLLFSFNIVNFFLYLSCLRRSSYRCRRSFHHAYFFRIFFFVLHFRRKDYYLRQRWPLQIKAASSKGLHIKGFHSLNSYAFLFYFVFILCKYWLFYR